VGQSADHWDGIHSTGTSTSRSWYEPEPAHSLRLITEAAQGRSAAILDLGAGTSMLVDRLLGSGFIDVTVLDISAHALDEVSGRLGPLASGVTFIAMTSFPGSQYDGTTSGTIAPSSTSSATRRTDRATSQSPKVLSVLAAH
jgi:hypothetical protein